MLRARRIINTRKHRKKNGISRFAVLPNDAL